MAGAATSVDEQLNQLGDARKLVLGDAAYYPQIVQGILPIIGPEARVELRRWGADFLAETFASPTLPLQQKETLCLIVLDTLKSMIENPTEDNGVVKSVVQTASSIYPLVLRWIVNNPYDTTSWEKMIAIKSRILRIWDSSPTGVRVCCIKFAQRVVLAQTGGPEADTKRGDILDISLAMVPQNHALAPPRNLEAEASGLLDRMLGIFQENTSDAVLVDATLNALSLIIRARPSVANRILNAILNFNPLKQANSPMTPKIRVMVKSMEKTTRMLLMHVLKRDPHNPLAGRISQHIERLMRSRTDIFDEASRKRGPPEPTDGLDPAKRQRLAANTAPSTLPRVEIPPLTPGPHTVAELFTATDDEGLKAFDVGILPADLVVKIGVTILASLDRGVFDHAINGIRARLLDLSKTDAQVPLNANTAPLGVDDDDDDYEPDFQPAEDTEQILNKLDVAPPEDIQQREPEVAIGPFKMPSPAAFTPEQTAEIGQGTVTRVFGVMQTLAEPASKKNKSGINRLAASSYDRDAWITVITRLATRAPAGLDDSSSDVKLEEGGRPSLSDTIRESLYLYVLEDFRRRIDIAVSWLCEEWYNDKIQMKDNPDCVQHYEKWTLKVLDGIVPYLDARDKVLTRFLSEIPGLSFELLERVKSLCRDPAMVNLALTSLLYLVMMRPPAREMALDAVEDVWKNYDDARPMAGKYLSKWRPGFIEQQKAIEEGEEKKEVTNGSENGVASAS